MLTVFGTSHISQVNVSSKTSVELHGGGGGGGGWRERDANAG